MFGLSPSVTEETSLFVGTAPYFPDRRADRGIPTTSVNLDVVKRWGSSGLLVGIEVSILSNVVVGV